MPRYTYPTSAPLAAAYFTPLHLSYLPASPGLGCPVDQVFEWLTDEPLASASLGQVYRGKLRPEWGGEEVAVKVQRPGVLESVSLDIFIMRRAALIFSKLPGVRGERGRYFL